jgi:predicted outer membrane repeat protein
MRMLTVPLLSALFLAHIASAQTVIEPGLVNGTWSVSGSPYLVEGDITVQFGTTLAIEPGVVVEFQGYYRFNVAGRLLAVGTETDTITFTVHDTTGFSDFEADLGGWHGIRFTPAYGSYDSSKIMYCKLEYGKALGQNWPDEDGGAICIESYDCLIIANCLVKSNTAGGQGGGAGGGISVIRCSPKIMRNTISFNWASSGGGINCYESNALIDDNTITFNSAESGGGIFCNQQPGPDIIHTSIAFNQAQFGGGIYCYESSPRLADNQIVNNSAEGGAGMTCNENSDPTITNTTIGYNSALSGGGIVCWNDCSPVLDNVAFSNNTATLEGGGVSAYNCDVQIDNCSFSENDAGEKGGAVSFSANTSVMEIPHEITVHKSSFLHNIAGESGALTVSNFAYTSLNVNVSIDDCEFIGNASDRYAGLDIWDSRVSISRCSFTDNTADSFAGAAGFRAGSAGTVSNCLFSSNIGQSSHSGGASVWNGARIDFMNCTFADNVAPYGGGLTVWSGGTATTTNCIFWGNSTDQIALDTLNGQGGTLRVNYCDVQGGEQAVHAIGTLSTLVWGSGNIDDDPLFLSPGNGDYHLQTGSPCIGTGIDTIAIDGSGCHCPPGDIEGNQRPNPAGSMPDIGAYESQYPVGVEENPGVHVTEFALHQNYPNPFNPSTVISYEIAGKMGQGPGATNVRLVIFDLVGREVAILLDERKAPGSYRITFNATGLASGVYLYRITAGTFVQTRKMILVR